LLEHEIHSLLLWAIVNVTAMRTLGGPLARLLAALVFLDLNGISITYGSLTVDAPLAGACGRLSEYGTHPAA
jgi:hypothetical protein